MADHSPPTNKVDDRPSIGWKEGLAIYGLFLALALVMTWPIVAQLGQAVPGRDGDVYVRLWTHRWVRDSLLAGRSPFFTEMLFFPNGISLASHNIAWFNIAAWLPLQLFMNEFAAYSIVHLNILALNGFAGYLFVFEYTRSRLPSLTGGLVIAFWPLILSHHHHPNIIIIAWVILAMLFLKRTIERSSLRDALLLAVFLALIGISRWQMLLIGGVLLAGYGLFLILRPGCFTKRNVLLIGLAGVLAGIVMLPLLWPGMKEFLFTSSDGSVFLVGEGNSIDLQALFVPSRYHPLWGSSLSEIYVNEFDVVLFTPFIGYTTLLLVALGLVLKWRDTRMWFLLALILLVLSMGNELRFGGVSYLPLPYRFIEDIAIVRLIRHPLRFGIVLAIPVALMASYGMLAIQQRRRLSVRQARIVALAILGLLLFEYATSSPMMPLDVPAWFERLAKDEGEFGIVDIPMDTRLNNEKFMFYQITHGKPMAGGKIARVPEKAFELIQKIPMLRYSPSYGMPPSGILTAAGQFSMLSENNIRYLVLHKELLGKPATDEWKTWLTLTPVYEDGELIVYDTTVKEPVANYVFDTDAGDIGIVDYAIDTPSADQVYPLAISIRWFLLEPVDVELDACFYAIGTDDTRHELDCLPISEEISIADLPVGTLLESNFEVPMDPWLDGGQYTIQVLLKESHSHRLAEEALALEDVTFSTLPRTVANEAEENPVATWDDTISLNAYEVSAGTSTEIGIDLRLQALTQMMESYKTFLHLVHADTGELVFQVDAVPRNWTYPTTWWQPYEIVTDSTDLAHGKLDPGNYQLWFGLYDEVSLERLSVSEANGVPLSETEDAILLYEFER